jgi:hypothetical protein
MSGIITAKRHGHKKGGVTSMYTRWQNMRRRCSDKRYRSYARYGGRGIKVCKKWDESFPDFLQDILDDLGEPPTAKHQIDRKDNNGHYEPGNVRWATREEQQRNTMRTHFITFNGKTQCLSDWAAELKIPRQCLSRRIHLGWTVERAFTKPVSPGRNPTTGQFL